MAKKEPGAEAADVREASFDERLGRLEALARARGQEARPRAAIARYQEGIELLKSCHEQLAGFRARVEELTREAEGGVRPFADDPDEPDQAPARRARDEPRDERG